MMNNMTSLRPIRRMCWRRCSTAQRRFLLWSQTIRSIIQTPQCVSSLRWQRSAWERLRQLDYTKSSNYRICSPVTPWWTAHITYFISQYPSLKKKKSIHFCPILKSFCLPLFVLILMQVLFDHVGSLKKYESVQDILKDFFELRMKYYVLRKDWLVGMLGAESAKLSNQARFILEKIQGTLVIGETCFFSLCLWFHTTRRSSIY